MTAPVYNLSNFGGLGANNLMFFSTLGIPNRAEIVEATSPNATLTFNTAGIEAPSGEVSSAEQAYAFEYAPSETFSGTDTVTVTYTVDGGAPQTVTFDVNVQGSNPTITLNQSALEAKGWNPEYGYNTPFSPIDGFTSDGNTPAVYLNDDVYRNTFNLLTPEFVEGVANGDADYLVGIEQFDQPFEPTVNLLDLYDGTGDYTFTAADILQYYTSTDGDTLSLENVTLVGNDQFNFTNNTVLEPVNGVYTIPAEALEYTADNGFPPLIAFTVTDGVQSLPTQVITFNNVNNALYNDSIQSNVEGAQANGLLQNGIEILNPTEVVDGNEVFTELVGRVDVGQDLVLTEAQLTQFFTDADGDTLSIDPDSVFAISGDTPPGGDSQNFPQTYVWDQGAAEAGVTQERTFSYDEATGTFTFSLNQADSNDTDYFIGFKVDDGTGQGGGETRYIRVAVGENVAPEVINDTIVLSENLGDATAVVETFDVNDGSVVSTEPLEAGEVIPQPADAEIIIDNFLADATSGDTNYTITKAELEGLFTDLDGDAIAADQFLFATAVDQASDTFVDVPVNYDAASETYSLDTTAFTDAGFDSFRFVANVQGGTDDSVQAVLKVDIASGSVVEKGVEGEDFLYANALPENRDNNAIKKRGEDSITGHYWVNSRDSSQNDNLVDGGEYAVIMGRRGELTADLTADEIIGGLESGDFIATKSYTSYGGYAVNAAFADGQIDSLVESANPNQTNNLTIGRIDANTGELLTGFGGALRNVNGSEIWNNFNPSNSLSGRNDNAYGDILAQQNDQTGGF